MKRTVLAVLLVSAVSAGLLAAEKPKPAAKDEPITPKEKIVLFNGKDLAGWVPFVAGKADPKTVWSVADGVIRCKGVPNGYLRTEKAYTNYKLHVEWRWPEKPSNSGVLLHMSGKDRVWPKSIECQLMSGNAGDIWLIGGTRVTAAGREVKGRRIVKKAKSSEKKPPAWNTYEIVCAGETVKAYVNGVLQADATKASETAGRICLQSEGSPIEFRNVHVEPVSPGDKPDAGGLDFALKDQDGKEVKLSGFRGKTVVLEWINWDCPFSRRQYTNGTMKTLAEKYAPKGVVWLAINSTHYATREKDKAWIAKHKLPYPILDDSPGKVGRQFKARTTPHMFIIDKAGRIAYQGAIDDDPPGKGAKVNYVEKALEELLAGKPVTTSETKPYGCTVKYRR